MSAPSPTAVNGSAPHPGVCIFLTGDTAVCALHILRSVRGLAAPVLHTPLDGPRRRGSPHYGIALSTGMLFMYYPDNPEGASHQLQWFGGILTQVAQRPPHSGQHDAAGSSRFSPRGSDSGNGLQVRVCRSGRCTAGSSTRPVRVSLSFCNWLRSASICAIRRETFRSGCRSSFGAAYPVAPAGDLFRVHARSAFPAGLDSVLPVRQEDVSVRRYCQDVSVSCRVYYQAHSASTKIKMPTT